MKYILKKSLWRCGKNGQFKHGEGETQMLNKEGFMCCLGHFAKQVGVTDAQLINTVNPNHLAWNMFGADKEGPVYDPAMVVGDSRSNSQLAYDLIQINDNVSTSAEEKLVSIRLRLESAGHELEVVP